VGEVTDRILDSNILIDLLNGVPEARDVLTGSGTPGISIVTWIEVMAGVRDDREERIARGLLDSLSVHPLSREIADEAVRVRRERRLKLPDAIILATARSLGCPLVTRNTRDFRPDGAEIQVPYRIDR